jgi:hypothetical protein
VLTPVFSPAALGLTTNRLVNFNGTTFASAAGLTPGTNPVLGVDSASGTGITITGDGDQRFLQFTRSGMTSYVAANNDLMNFRSLWVGSTPSDPPSDGIIATAKQFYFTDGSAVVRGLFDVATSGGAGTSVAAVGDFVFRSDAGSSNQAHFSASTHAYFSITPGLSAGAAAGTLFRGRSSTTNTREAALLQASFPTSTDASRKARLVCSVYDTAAREAWRAEADGSAAMLGFYGSSAVAKQSVSGSRGGNAALADLLTKLATLGLITDGTSA